MGSQKRPRLLPLSSLPSAPSSNQPRKRVSDVVMGLPCQNTLADKRNSHLISNQEVHGCSDDGDVNRFSHHTSGKMLINCQAPDGHQNSQNHNEKTEESMKPPKRIAPDPNLYSGRQSSLSIAMHPFNALPTSHSFPKGNFGNFSSVTAAQIDHNDFSPPVNGLKRTVDISMAATETLDLLNCRMSRVPPPIETSETTLGPFKIDLNGLDSASEEDAAGLDLDLHL